MSTTISFYEIRLGLLSDPSDEIVLSPELNNSVEITENDAVIEGEQITASGSIRSITEPGNPRSVTVMADWVPRADREELAARKGVMQQYRDWDGRQIFGTFAALDVTPQNGAQSVVTFVFRQRSYSMEL